MIFHKVFNRPFRQQHKFGIGTEIVQQNGIFHRHRVVHAVQKHKFSYGGQFVVRHDFMRAHLFFLRHCAVFPFSVGVCAHFRAEIYNAAAEISRGGFFITEFFINRKPVVRAVDDFIDKLVYHLVARFVEKPFHRDKLFKRPCGSPYVKRLLVKVIEFVLEKVSYKRRNLLVPGNFVIRPERAKRKDTRPPVNRARRPEKPAGVNRRQDFFNP